MILIECVPNISEGKIQDIINQINDWIQWLEETKLKIMKMRDVDPGEEKEERVPGE